MQSNLSIVDRYTRLAGGLLIFGLGARQKRSRALLMSLGAMKVAEGITGWCPMKYALQSLEQLGLNHNSSSPHPRKQTAAHADRAEHSPPRAEQSQPEQHEEQHAHNLHSDYYSSSDFSPH